MSAVRVCQFIGRLRRRSLLDGRAEITEGAQLPDQAARTGSEGLARSRDSIGEDVLTRHGALMGRIKLSYGTDYETFERDIVSVVNRYAAFVHTLPATADNYFSNRGGLLQLGLEIGFYALQATDGQIFSGRASISTRRELEPRWRLATFIAGLCHELHRTLSHLVVNNARGDQWPAYLEPLRTWLGAADTERYEIHWLPDAVEVRSLGILALPHIVPVEALQHLAHANSTIVPQMLACIAGMASQHERNVLNEIVLRAAALVIDRELRTMRERMGRSITGEHVTHYLLHALRRLIASNATWRPNTEKSRVWFALDGLFLVWPSAAADMQRLIDTERFVGLPQRPVDIIAVLTTAGLVHPPEGDGDTWTIYPPGTQSPMAAIRIRTPEALFEHGVPAPAPIRLLAPPSNASAQGSLDLPRPRAVTDASKSESSDSRAQASRAAAPTRTFRLLAPARLDPSIRKALDWGNYLRIEKSD